MGITAAVLTGASAVDSHRTERKAKREQERQQAKMEKAEANQKAKDLAATPTKGTGVGRRIALERQQILRSAGKGRSGSVIRRGTALG